MSGLVFAGSDYTYENVTILGSNMGGTGKVPPIEAIRVTVGSDDDSVAIGDVMTWGIEPQYTDGNALGVKVDRCKRNCSEDISNSYSGKGPYAGVMITTATSNDQGASTTWSNSNPMANRNSNAFMAIRGFVDAKLDGDLCSLGDVLFINGAKTAASFATGKNIKHQKSYTSVDIGVCLETRSTDGLAKVWLR